MKGSIHSLPFHSHPFSLICLHSCDYCHLIVQLHPPTTIYVATIMKRTGKEQGVLSSVCSQDYNLAAAFGDYRRSLRRASECGRGLMFRWENIFKFRQHPPFTFLKKLLSWRRGSWQMQKKINFIFNHPFTLLTRPKHEISLKFFFIVV